MKRMLLTVLGVLIVPGMMGINHESSRGLQIAPVLQAKEGDSHCDVKSAKGSYALSLNGSIVGFGDAAGIGVMVLDGKGNVAGSAAGKVAGVLVTSPMTGSYTVHQDCTGTFTLSFPAALGGVTLFGSAVIYNDGKDADVLITDSTPVATQFTGSAHRQ